jgi:chromosome segregation ATPase
MVALRLSLLAASLFVAQGTPVPAQSTDSAVLAEMTALRKSVDQLVAVVKLFVQQAADRDTALLLAQLIDTDERRITQMQQRIDLLRTNRTAVDAEMAQMRGAVDTYSRMAAGDPTGKAQAVMEQEKARTAAQLERKTSSISQLDDQIAQLETEIADKRNSVADMRRRLDQRIGRRP